jgi:ATP-binding cassette subfamily G (WHITE) protein 1
MGASGGGKSTLVSALSLRLDTRKMNVTGDFRLNGREYSKSVLKAMSAYVMQDDLLHAELTVAETVSYAAQLRLAGKCTKAERIARELVCLCIRLRFCHIDILHGLIQVATWQFQRLV